MGPIWNPVAHPIWVPMGPVYIASWAVPSLLTLVMISDDLALILLMTPPPPPPPSTSVSRFSGCRLDFHGENV